MSKDKEYHKDETFYTQCQETSSTNSLYPRKKKESKKEELTGKTEHLSKVLTMTLRSELTYS